MAITTAWGANSCEWAVWFQAHNKLDSRANTFDSVAWQSEHAPLLRTAQSQLELEGYTVFQEDQNWFKLVGSNGTELHGKPDMVAISADGSEGIICDAKTGSPHDYHHMQVVLYMWAVPQAFPGWRDVRFSGRLVYKTESVKIPNNAVSDAFARNLIDLIKRVAANEVALKVPSARECAFLPNHVG